MDFNRFKRFHKIILPSYKETRIGNKTVCASIGTDTNEELNYDDRRIAFKKIGTQSAFINFNNNNSRTSSNIAKMYRSYFNVPNKSKDIRLERTVSKFSRIK